MGRWQCRIVAGATEPRVCLAVRVAECCARPHADGAQLAAEPGGARCPQPLPYRSLLGSLLWIAKCTRPDIMFAVVYLSHYCTSFGKPHWGNPLRVLRNLVHTKNMHFVLTATTSECSQWCRSGQTLTGPPTRMAADLSVVDWCTSMARWSAGTPVDRRLWL